MFIRVFVKIIGNSRLFHSGLIVVFMSHDMYVIFTFCVISCVIYTFVSVLENSFSQNEQLNIKVFRLSSKWSLLSYGPGAHFMNDFSIVIQIQWNFFFSVTPL